MLALWEIHPPLLFSSDMGTFCWIGLNVFNMFSQLSTSVTPSSQDHYHTLPDNTKQYQEYNNTLFSVQLHRSRQDNKQKHELVLRRTSWCFVFLWPRHVFTKYFARLLKIHQEQTITYMGPVVTSQKLSRTFYFDNKQKHQLVLRRTSWCFLLLSPHHFSRNILSKV